jgi:hypothetical protein
MAAAFHSFGERRRVHEHRSRGPASASFSQRPLGYSDLQKRFQMGGPVPRRMAGRGTYTAALGSWLTPGSYGISYVGSRPNYLCDPNLARSQRTITAHFKVSCLANPAPGQMGNAGTGTVQGSGINLWNSGFMKFQVRERHDSQFRAEFFNLFNRRQFDDPYAYPGNNPRRAKSPARAIMCTIRLRGLSNSG